MQRLNNYNRIAKSYQQANTKPDKLFSTLPTVIKLAGKFKDKTILDLGCGDGFFTTAFAKRGTKKAIGIDNSKKQIELAKKAQLQNTEYLLGDVFKNKLPNADIIIAPYIINYSTNKQDLTKLFKNIFNSLKSQGKLIAVVDLPEGKNMKKYGAVKKILGKKVDCAEIAIQLFDNKKLICTLNAIYFTQETLVKTLLAVGFKDIKWHKPIVSTNGIKKYGHDFWKGYTKSSELGYLTATKK